MASKDKIVFVRLTQIQTKALDQYVKEANRKPSAMSRISRSDAIRHAVSSFLDRASPRDPTLLSTIFAEEDIDRVSDQ